MLISRKRRHSFTAEYICSYNNSLLGKRKKSVNENYELDYGSSKRLCPNESDVTNLKKLFRQFSKQPDILLQDVRQLMYRLDLLLFFYHRKSVYKNMCHSSVHMTYGDPEINDVYLFYKKQFINIKVEYVDTYYIDPVISYARLFTIENQPFSIRRYFNNFIKFLFSTPHQTLNNIKYYVIYTNIHLDINEEMRLKPRKSKKFYPFKFEKMESCDILKYFLSINLYEEPVDHYQFSKKELKEEFFAQLKTCLTTMKILKSNNFSLQAIKEAFLDKLVFAVNKPNRENLKSIIQHELKTQNYLPHREDLLHNLIDFKTQQVKPLRNTMYEITFLMLLVHNMFCDDSRISFINFVRCEMSNYITINYKNGIICIKTHTSGESLCTELFPVRKYKTKNLLSINKLFTSFTKLFAQKIKYFLVYSDSNFDTTTEDAGNKDSPLPSKFNPLDDKVKNNVNKIFSWISQSGLYKITQETESLLDETNQLSSIGSINTDGTVPEDEAELNQKFFNKLIFGFNQYNAAELNTIIKSKLKDSNAPYTFEELYETVQRWLESHSINILSKQIVLKILTDIRNNKSSQSNFLKNSDDEIRFANSVIYWKGTFDYNLFLDFLMIGDGKQYLNVLKGYDIKLANVSSILHGVTSSNRAIKNFKELFNMWFDKDGKKSVYLKTLETEGVRLASISSILHGCKSSAAFSFMELYSLWFDDTGKKKIYLLRLEENGVDLIHITSILSGSGSKAAQAFENLYFLWFDANGNKTEYLRMFEEDSINLSNISNILAGSGNKAALAFKELYSLWFDNQGKKSDYLLNLEKHGIDLFHISSILNTSGAKAAYAFEHLYRLLFDEKGNKTRYLNVVKENNVNLSNISNIISGAGVKASRAFKELFDVWFDANGNKTVYLVEIEKAGIDIASMSSILSRAGVNAATTFKKLYILWFDNNGNKTEYLKTLERNKIKLSNVCSILTGAGSMAPQAFKELYDLWFEDVKLKPDYLLVLQKEKISLSSISIILHRSGVKAAEAFKDLYKLWFDNQGVKTKYLTTLEDNGINLSNICSILGKAGHKAADAFKEFYNLLFDVHQEKSRYSKILEENNVNLAYFSTILGGAGRSAEKAFKKLFNIWFDEQGCRTIHLQTLEEHGLSIGAVCNILQKAGANSATAFKDLYDLWFDKRGNKTVYLKTLETDGIDLNIIAKILHGSGTNAHMTFKKLYNCWFDDKQIRNSHLSHFLKEGGKEFSVRKLSGVLIGSGTNATRAFLNLHNLWFDQQGNRKDNLNNFMVDRDTQKGFTMHELVSIIGGSGIKATKSIEQLHDIFFNKQGETTELLHDFYKSGFNSSNLSTLLCETGFNASSAVLKFHSACFKTNEKDSMLDNFFIKGFTPHDLCNILSGSAEGFKKFYNFCFLGETQIYLDHFINDEKGFTIKHLATMLHGAGSNICLALQSFHDICYDNNGRRTAILNDFQEVNFQPRYLSKVFSTAGKNIAHLLVEFHKSCFQKEFLHHFLAEGDIFTIKKLSRILVGSEYQVCVLFEQLHGLCFKRSGLKTKYFKKLLKNIDTTEILDILSSQLA